MMEWKEKSGRNDEEGFFPLSPYSRPLDVFSCSLFIGPPPVFERLNRLFSGADSLIYGNRAEIIVLFPIS